MEDEISKHTKKIYRTAKSDKHSFGEKLKDIAVEIFIIVFAVTLSIWFHGWAEHRHEQKEVKAFLEGLKADLTKDITLLERNKGVVSELDSNFHFLMAFEKDKTGNKDAERKVFHSLSFDLIVTRPDIGRYEGFKSSGKIGAIENDSLKQEILVFYEQTIPDLVYGENYVNTLQTRILDLQIERNYQVAITDFVTTNKLKSLFSLGVHNLEVNIKGYNETIKQAKTIIDRIDKENQ